MVHLAQSNYIDNLSSVFARSQLRNKQNIALFWLHNESLHIQLTKNPVTSDFHLSQGKENPSLPMAGEEIPIIFKNQFAKFRNFVTHFISSNGLRNFRKLFSVEFAFCLISLRNVWLLLSNGSRSTRLNQSRPADEIGVN